MLKPCILRSNESWWVWHPKLPLLFVFKFRFLY